LPGSGPVTFQVETNSFSRLAATRTKAALPSGAMMRSLISPSANSGTSSGSTASSRRRPS
jgi:hypothetical protein